MTRPDDYPKTPLDFPLRVHRMVPVSRIAEAVNAERARIAEAVKGLPVYSSAEYVLLPAVSLPAVLAIVEGKE